MLFVAGCQGWQPTRPDAGSKSVNVAKKSENKQGDGAERKETDESKVKTAGRAPVASTGLDERSREIERSLGAK